MWGVEAEWVRENKDGKNCYRIKGFSFVFLLYSSIEVREMVCACSVASVVSDVLRSHGL